MRLARALRRFPIQDHATWKAASDRQDPLALMEESNQGRMPQLTPVRHGRMLQSPFTFYRGAALNMAADLASTSASGIRVQACGDCHLLNFGAYATPERRVIFDINDLDETLPAPWEWDVKRLAASFVLACRSNCFSEDKGRDAVLSCVRSYRKRMKQYSEMNVLDVWYASIEMEKLIPKIHDKTTAKRMKKRGLGYAYTGADVAFDPVLLIEDVKLDLNSLPLKYIRTFKLAGKSARIDLLEAYQDAEWNGLVDGVPTRVTRSGWSDTVLRFAVNLIGAPPLKGTEYADYRAAAETETIVGLGLELQIPTGQYFDDKLLNLGTNRVTFRPQLGVVHKQGKWTTEFTASSWLYTDNDSFFAPTGTSPTKTSWVRSAMPLS